MNGKIIIYCNDVAAGIIKDTIGRQYLFNLKEWKSGPFPPEINMEVTFDRSNGWARNISSFMMPPQAAAAVQEIPYRLYQYA